MKTIYFSHFLQVDIVFNSKEELIKWAKATADSHCHRLICQSRRENAQYLTCDKYGHGRQTNIDVEDPRNTGTKKCGCPFKLIGKKSRFDELWRLTVSDGRHTHRPALFPHGQGTTSRITPQQKARIKELRNSHVKPMLIMDRLRKDDPTIQTSMKHVYNVVAKIKSEEMEGMTVIHFMMHNFQQGEYRYWHRVDSETSNTITYIMFACPESIKLLRLFPYVILMDCTYKTNKYAMPLLAIIGITPVGRNFTIVVAFMSHEDADTYEWTLNCLKELLDGVEPNAILTDMELGLLKALPNVFPFSYHMLCIFHINRNVEANATKFMRGNNDQGLIFRRGLWAKLEKFVRAYTRNVYHFGNTSTNTVVSAHSFAKGWLNASTGGLDNVQGKLRDQVYIQISQLKCDFSLSSKIRKHTAAWPCFQGLICYVTHLALEKLDQEMESPAMQDSNLHPLWSTMTVEPSELPEYQVKRKEITKGRPKNNSTKRDPSGWQYHIDEETIKLSCGSKGRQTSSGAKIPKAKVERSTDGILQSKMKGRGSRIPTQKSAAPTIHAHERIDFYSFVPRFMVRLIQDYVNVMADGNCGYRCFTQAVYGDQERWPQVRGELFIELYEHANVYTAMFDSTGYVEVICKCDWNSGPCPQAYWMDMNEMGLAIATRYSALVVNLSA
ncbi:PREDICTED: protein FAR1-RELATED SEQUENCE 5-like [Erythranthe guttata]|uniref:protein FAR1-RELATED SEQUENCE 5-like n=1 Tax=Erythranthe guttata TaxID=4155 RepID=UPI00064D9D73|nr:PREDICTED: protein FAR1-RELATED SEQUENCE 5-like [Erythranthe guttata]|eukprot:XP_012832959.1 PREDICTED: protein FAR1-RELATED SEQUENCE 5-like [Erythranthe guttata]